MVFALYLFYITLRLHLLFFILFYFTYERDMYLYNVHHQLFVTVYPALC